MRFATANLFPAKNWFYFPLAAHRIHTGVDTMHTKERFQLSVRWMCFALLLTAALLRLLPQLTLTGTWERLRGTTETAAPTVREDEEPTYPTMLYVKPDEPSPLAPSDATVPVDNRAGVEFDAQALLSQPLPLAASDEPLILIVHTHATEGYAETASEDYHTTDTDYSIVRVGQAIADRLNAAGIITLHDKTLNDLPGYDSAYDRTAQVISRYLEEYPSIRMVIDVHRDAVTATDGTELAMTAELEGEPAAQLLFVMGTDAGGLEHPGWQGNLAVALQLQARCTARAPGLFRELSLRSARYNEHLTPCSVLLEVGSAGNTLDEALRSADFFARQLIELIEAQ